MRVFIFFFAIIIVSCETYLIPEARMYTPRAPQIYRTPPSRIPTSQPRQTVSSPEQKRIRAEEELRQNKEPALPNIAAPRIPEKRSYPIALAIPGKPGFVYNPYNNNPVFIKDIPSGKTVLDPQDPNKEHKFKVP